MKDVCMLIAFNDFEILNAIDQLHKYSLIMKHINRKKTNIQHKQYTVETDIIRFKKTLDSNLR